jgi:hypothetical protein
MSEPKNPSESLGWFRGDSALENRPFPLLRPNPKESLPGGLFVAAGALAYWILAREKSPSSLALPALVGGLPVLGGLAWMIRRRLHQAIFLSGQLLLIVLWTAGDLRRAPFPLGAVPLLPAGLMLWGLLGMARKADELECRVLQGALALASGIALCAFIVYGLAETLGAHRAPAIFWFGVLVLGWYAGLAIVARRYS